MARRRCCWTATPAGRATTWCVRSIERGKAAGGPKLQRAVAPTTHTQLTPLPVSYLPDVQWAALRQAEAALPAAADGGAGDRDPPTRPASPGADGGAAAADPPVSAAAADSSMVVDLLDDDDDGDGGAAASSAAAVPVDPTGLLTWMRDGKIAKKRAMLQR